MKTVIEIDNLTEAQQIALEDMLACWRELGSIGSSRWTKFYADGDGNFHPMITIDGHKPVSTKLIDNKLKWPEGSGGHYQIDFDWIAWKLIEQKQNQ